MYSGSKQKWTDYLKKLTKIGSFLSLEELALKRAEKRHIWAKSISPFYVDSILTSSKWLLTYVVVGGVLYTTGGGLPEKRGHGIK